MKNILLLLSLCIVFSLFSCKETNKEVSDNSVQEAVADNAAERADVDMVVDYQCPMDCEQGKTYSESGACDVCKMDLKKLNKKNQGDLNKDEAVSSEEH
jgi:hypothetical protein